MPCIINHMIKITHILLADCRQVIIVQMLYEQRNYPGYTKPTKILANFPITCNMGKREI